MVLSNHASFNPGGMALKIADIYLADLLVEEKPKEEPKKEYTRVEVDPAILEKYVGVYQLESGVLGTVTRAGNKLMGQIPGQPRVELIPISETRFIAAEAGFEVSFERDQAGEIFQAIMHQGGEDKIASKVEPFSLSPDQMAEFEGDYYSDELGTTYSIILKDERLVAQHRRHEDIALSATNTDKFRGQIWFFRDVQFIRDDNNQITGCRVSSGRVRNLLFDKMNRNGRLTTKEE